MKAWIKHLFHHHKWKIIKERSMVQTYAHTTAEIHYIEYHMQCEICGKLAYKRLG